MSSNVKVLLAVVGSAILLLFAAPLGSTMMDGGMMRGMSSMLGGGIFGLFVMLLFWGLVVAPCSSRLSSG